jgi:hypothetical protein
MSRAKKQSTYHESIIDLIVYILMKDDEYIKNIDSGNAFDKILRNYHQFNYAGEKVYRVMSRMERYYQFSADAWNNRKNRKELYFEHLVPIKLIKKQLFDLKVAGNVNQNTVKEIMNSTKIVVITRQDQKKVDNKYKTSIPSNGIDRLTAQEIFIAKETLKNDLFWESNV